MWTFVQSTGEMLDPDGNLAGTGYAGGGLDPANELAVASKNNPDAQSRHDMGPLPCGFYTMEAPILSHVVGQYAIPLKPDNENEMFGRDAFYCHGDSRVHPGFASDGCIIQTHDVRVKMWESVDHRIQVVASLSN